MQQLFLTLPLNTDPLNVNIHTPCTCKDYMDFDGNTEHTEGKSKGKLTSDNFLSLKRTQEHTAHKQITLWTCKSIWAWVDCWYCFHAHSEIYAISVFDEKISGTNTARSIALFSSCSFEQRGWRILSRKSEIKHIEPFIKVLLCSEKKNCSKQNDLCARGQRMLCNQLATSTFGNTILTPAGCKRLGSSTLKVRNYF